ncbi:SDR family NAD(P)-dependent oxidoreductase [Iodidimonas sp. SYSU 1G8]|uniref:SDR family NAD(P)-dependent oxidoreductase n=1 Tax=Iodidimonas sp. SYSU 1G8 TaxID=3133967 RepID=UPI0031FE4685
MNRLCEGRVCVVTGAGRGIGREYAKMLASQGARVLVNDLGAAADGVGADRTPAQLVVDEIKAAGGDAAANYDDVSDFKAAKRMIDQAIETWGKLDVVINNAGILRDRMLVNMTEEEWDVVIKVHLKGTFGPAHHAAAHWRDVVKATGAPVDARIINTSSVSGIYGNIGQTNYGAAKQGIAAFSIIAARELRRYGITVNCIAPGALTRLTENLRERTEEEKKQGDPFWIAPIVTWLASTESRDVTGRMFEASGRILAIAEGWHRGPVTEPIADPTRLGPVVERLVAKARLNAGMDGMDLD